MPARHLVVLVALSAAAALPAQQVRSPVGADPAVPPLSPAVAARPSAGCVVPPSRSPQARLFNGQSWTDGVVPYELHASVTPAMAASFVAAAQELETRVNVQFVPRTTEPDWVLVRDSTINSSPIGRQGGQQTMFVANWNQRFEIVHGMMHVLGFWHEHQRPDRDTFVAVQFQNVDPLRTVEFQRVPSGTTYGLPYDFDSVTHFSGTEGGIGGATTISVLPPNQAQQSAIGQRTHLSTGDLETLRRTYGSLVPPTITTLSPTTVPAYQPPPIVITGLLFDEVQRVLVGGVQTSFLRLSPTQMQIVLAPNPVIGPLDVVVESGVGGSAPATLQIVGQDPPVFSGPPVLNRGFPFPFTVNSDAGLINVLVAAYDNVPSIAPGIVSLGLGNNFTTLGEAARGLSNASGKWTVSILGPNVPLGTLVWMQVVVYDPMNFTLPLSSSNVLQVQAF